jgi:hypothetical protein
LDCGYSLSLAEGEDGALLLHCFGGCSYGALMSALVEYGMFGDGGFDPEPRIVARHDRLGEDEQRRIELACQSYRGVTVDDGRIGVYLRSRAIGITSPVLRFSETAPHRLGARLPAMVAPVVDVNGAQTGVHMTFLRSDGSGKADLGSRELQRECRGVIRSGAIRLAAYDPNRPLIVAEGVETTLSAMEIFNLPGWSAIHAAGVGSMALPACVQRVVIAADNDRSGAGQRNALVACRRWTAEGRAVRLAMPPTDGMLTIPSGSLAVTSNVTVFIMRCVAT